jgi:hypothetical protein
LESVTIPASVTSIGFWAFKDCKSLTNVVIPSPSATIGNYAFDNCRSLTSVTLSRQARIERGAFPSSAQRKYLN